MFDGDFWLANGRSWFRKVFPSWLSCHCDGASWLAEENSWPTFYQAG
jgi:hypothetical protein